MSTEKEVKDVLSTVGEEAEKKVMQDEEKESKIHASSLKSSKKVESMKKSVSIKDIDEKSVQPLSYTSMDTINFLKYRESSSNMYSIPSQFFQRAVDGNVVDPSVQPYNEEDIPKPFHVTIPGYSEDKYRIFEEKKEKFTPSHTGPDISDFPPTWVPRFEPDPYFKKQAIGYNWDEQLCFRMDKFPYLNAFFSPINPEDSKMYDQMVPWCAYPYGVPVVEKEQPKYSYYTSFFCCGQGAETPKSEGEEINFNIDENDNIAYTSEYKGKTEDYVSTNISKRFTDNINEITKNLSGSFNRMQSKFSQVMS